MLVREDIRLNWDRVKPGLYWIHSNLGPEWRPEDLYTAVQVGAAELWMDPEVEDGFAILQERKAPFDGTKTLLLWVAYYNGGNGVEEYLPDIEAMAKARGCSSVEFWSPRVGMGRLVAPAGYRVANVVYRKNLEGVE